MRVALLTDGIWPYVLGGMQKHSYYLCRYLAQQGITVDLFHYNDSTYDITALEFFTPEERNKIQAHVLEFPKGKIFPGHYIYKNYIYSRLIAQAMAPTLAQYDFIYAKGFTPWYLLNQKRKGKLNCAPIGVKFHGYEMFQTSPNLKTKLQHLLLLRRPVKRISLMADVVFSYGGKITEIIRGLGVNPNRIIEMPSGVEQEWITTAIKPTEPPLKFLFLGRYERRKGIEELNTALQHLFQLPTPEFRFHFIGPIPDNKKLKSKACIYHGEIRDRKTLLNTLQQADVLVCPSWSEGMPNVILEAMANGLAVLATDTGATRLLVNEQTGYLLPNAHPEELAKQLLQFLNTSPQLIHQKKQNALEKIKAQFMWETLITQLIEKIKAPPKA